MAPDNFDGAVRRPPGDGIGGSPPAAAAASDGEFPAGRTRHLVAAPMAEKHERVGRWECQPRRFA